MEGGNQERKPDVQVVNRRCSQLKGLSSLSSSPGVNAAEANVLYAAQQTQKPGRQERWEESRKGSCKCKLRTGMGFVSPPHMEWQSPPADLMCHHQQAERKQPREEIQAESSKCLS